MPPPPRSVVRATVICDASFCPYTKAAGWAAWIVVNPIGEPVFRIKRSGLFRTGPSNPTVAERLACFNGLWLAYVAGAREILVQNDCLDVIQRGENNEGYADAMREHWPDAQVSWRHVKGHTTHEASRFYVNRWCDTEAKAIMKRQRNKVRQADGKSRYKGKGSRGNRRRPNR